MCGIVGMIRGAGGVDPDTLVAMRDSLRHRGPDDGGTYISKDTKVGLGHRRLSIIDLSTNGHQPMTNEDGTIWLVYNGEIYNFQEIREQLLRAGHTFRSDTDSEIIVHAYEEWGVTSVERFRGMFAYALWDDNLRKLFLVRDRLGIKPLFYWHSGANLAFGSELKALSANPDIPQVIDETAIYDFVTYLYVPTPKTIYKDIKKLPPAHYAEFSDGKLTFKQYWDPPFRGNARISESDAADIIESKLQEVIDLHLISDVPLGVTLSGGLDSSTITALAAKSKNDPLHTFSIGFDVAEHDETHFARMVADQYRTRHHELKVTRQTAAGLSDKIIEMYDEPFADSSAIPTFCVSELARRNVTVALSGEGGDEVFGGYSWYSSWLRFAKRDFLPAPLRRTLFGCPAKLMPPGFKGQWTLHTASLDPVERYAKLTCASLKHEKAKLFSKTFLRKFDGYDDYWYFRDHWRDDLDPLSRMQYLDMKTYLHDDILTKVDRASMSVSLEARVPLLDHELIETVTDLPVEVRNKGYEKKHILKVAMSKNLPEPLLMRKKQGFSVPFYAWVKESNQREIQPIFDTVFDADMLREGKAVTADNYWRLMVVNKWLTENA